MILLILCIFHSFTVWRGAYLSVEHFPTMTEQNKYFSIRQYCHFRDSHYSALFTLEWYFEHKINEVNIFLLSSAQEVRYLPRHRICSPGTCKARLSAARKCTSFKEDYLLQKSFSQTRSCRYGYSPLTSCLSRFDVSTQVPAYCRVQHVPG